jgi:hypothetical protein
MNETSNVVPLRQPDEIDDPLTNILRSGARQLLAQAVEMEAEAFLAVVKGLKLPDGRDRLVRHGHGPVRTIQTGIGAVEVARVKIRDRATASDVERLRFTSATATLGTTHEELGRTFAGALLAGHLTQTGISKEEADVYAEGLRRGGAVVSARVADNDAARLQAVMDRSAVRVADRAAAYRKSGWKTFDPNATPYAPMEEKLCIFGAAQKLPTIQGLTIAASRTRAAAAPEAAKILVESFGNPVTAAEQLDRTFGFFLTPAAMEALTAALVERLKGSVIVDIDVRAAAQTATFTFICAWGAGTAVFAVPTGMSR